MRKNILLVHRVTSRHLSPSLHAAVSAFTPKSTKLIIKVRHIGKSCKQKAAKLNVTARRAVSDQIHNIPIKLYEVYSRVRSRPRGLYIKFTSQRLVQTPPNPNFTKIRSVVMEPNHEVERAETKPQSRLKAWKWRFLELLMLKCMKNTSKTSPKQKQQTRQ